MSQDSKRKKKTHVLPHRQIPAYLGYIDINIINCICEYSLMFRKEIFKGTVIVDMGGQNVNQKAHEFCKKTELIIFQF